jgi:hypothetical protein
MDGKTDLVKIDSPKLSNKIEYTAEKIGKDIDNVIDKLIPSREIRERIIDNLLNPIEDEIGQENKEIIVSEFEKRRVLAGKIIKTNYQEELFTSNILDNEGNNHINGLDKNKVQVAIEKLKELHVDELQVNLGMLQAL